MVSRVPESMAALSILALWGSHVYTLSHSVAEYMAIECMPWENNMRNIIILMLLWHHLVINEVWYHWVHIDGTRCIPSSSFEYNERTDFWLHLVM